MSSPKREKRRKKAMATKEQSPSEGQRSSLEAEAVDDMINLVNMTEAGLLQNLLLRHKQGVIYTYIGSVLVAVNPYQEFPIYTAEQVQLYRGRKLGELPPHIFAVAETCYFNTTRHLRNQCCIISGETGAGKTESSKLILQYLAAVSGKLSEHRIEEQILESNPILEAFGNAKTVHNDNSSRFGKYVEIFFNGDGAIEGARVEQYLLEKSRVCHQAPQEQNYHIFYCLLAGVSAEEKRTLRLGNAEEYKFLTKGDCVVCESRDDAEEFGQVHAALKILTFSESQCRDVFKLLAAILHLGNVCFEATIQDNLETSDVTKSEHLSVAASLLQVQTSTLTSSLTHRSFNTNRERVTKPLSSEQAADSRDAFVKAIYNKLFVWIVEKLNSVTYKELANSPRSSYRSIGLLDIFGFENFNTNSFEQLCINFANEKLQQLFVSYIFKLEQEEYLKEGVVWTTIDFSDNKSVLDLMAEKPCNLLALIDEESHFPKGSDSTMLFKMTEHHSRNKNFIGSKSEHDANFGILHFAGVVYYDSKGFLEKNRDAVSSDLIRTVQTSTNKLLRQIFESELSSNDVKITNNRRVTITPKSTLRSLTDKSKQVPTLSGQFRQSLDSLMKALTACQPFFVRCFKPNSDKRSEVFDKDLCLRQLRYSGIVDTVRIRKLGYPVRHTFEEFQQRYKLLLRKTSHQPKTEAPAACCVAICKTTIKDKDGWKLGKTKIFLKDAHDALLERLRDEEFSKMAVVIQRFTRGHKHRQSFLKKRRAAIVLQRNWRARRQNRQFQKLHEAHGNQREAAITIQRHVRGYLARQHWKRRREAVVLLQAYTRGFLTRRAVRRTTDDVLASPLENKNWDLIALALQQELEQLVHDSQLQDEEPDPQVPPTTELKQEPESEEFETSTPSPPRDEEDDDDASVDDDDDDDEFSFKRFSVRHFQGGVDHAHIHQRLKQPLLFHDDEGDALACLTVWWMILRFMEDVEEPKSVAAVSQTSGDVWRPPPRGKKQNHPTAAPEQKMQKKKKKKKKLRGGNDGAIAETRIETEDEDVLIGEDPALDRPLTSLEKLHVISGYALWRPGIRDEVLCQICKQLQSNSSRRSRVLGWTLLSICLGLFPPTDLLVKYLESFIRRGPSGYRVYCSERLGRTVANGERKELPCWMELQAAKTKEPIDVTVTLMDDRTVQLQLDSSSTSAEVCRAVVDRIGLRDAYGFSLFISLHDKMWSLGSGGKHVFDAVSQCEQEVKRRGQDEEGGAAPWSLSFQKELFAPWHDCSADGVGTDLIYRQVVKGVKSGKYVSEKEDDYVQLAVKHYHAQFGSVHSADNVQRVVEEFISTPLIESKSKTKWVQLISSALLQSPFAAEQWSKDIVKGELVDVARQKWHLHFSKFYEVTMMSGPALPKTRFTVAVNWKSIFFMDGRERILMELPYHQVKDVQTLSDGTIGVQSVSLSTVRGDFVLKCEEAVDMAALIVETTEGLMEHSVYALAQQDFSKSDDPGVLVCRRGDLLLVDRGEDYSPRTTWIHATNQRTGTSGTVHKDMLQFLPVCTKLSEDVLEVLSPVQGKPSPVPSVPKREELVAPVSLKEFAYENFRSGGKDPGRQGGARGPGKEKLWLRCKEPLKQPLMKTLTDNSELSTQACSAFTAILKYMGDYPIKHIRSPVELTDQIFGPATRHEALQDEIYCQIMRQMTGNDNRLSMERGWQLLWLCSGLFPPSKSLMRHTRSFLQSRRRELLADGCLQRLQEISRKEPRKRPPHLVEVDAIQQNSTQIFHKVHFPNDTSEIFEVTSTTSIKDLCSSVASELKLSSDDGYGLYLKTATKTVSLDEQKYFFDSLKLTPDVPKKARRAKEGNPTNMPYRVIFKRKLWFNINPGKDQVADLTFHFPQELPKYLGGYHRCSREDMIQLGALLFRSKVDSDRSQFVMIPRMLKELVPADQIQLMSTEEWKKHIIVSYGEQSGTTADEAKVAFLKAVSAWPTFGSAFFDVKQSCESGLPSSLLIAISKRGVSLMDPENKSLLVMHPLSRITQYHSKGGSFHMTVNTPQSSGTFVCETPKADTMEDILRSYIRMYARQRQAFRRRNHMFT